jgi:hypothetical protein
MEQTAIVGCSAWHILGMVFVQNSSHDVCYEKLKKRMLKKIIPNTGYKVKCLNWASTT